MPARRCANPIGVQHVWDAVRSILHQRQQTDMSRLAKHLHKTREMSPEMVELHVRQALQDNLIVCVKKNGQKGTSKMGMICETYRIPSADSNTPIDDGHDWYCIECHLAGDVTLCRTCHRVYHRECAANGRINKRLGDIKRREDGEARLGSPPTVVEDDKKEVTTVEDNKKDITNVEDNKKGITTVEDNKQDVTTVEDNEKDATTVEDNKKVITVEDDKKDITTVEDDEKDITVEDVSSSEKEDIRNGKEENAMNVLDVDEDVCSVCFMLQSEQPGIIERDELNYLLNFTINRIRIWLPPNITDTMAPQVLQPWSSEQEVAWRARQLLYQPMDIPIMEMKVRMKEYCKLAEFHADVLTIQHNVAIYHGLESQEMDSSELMLTDCKYDLVEMRQCVDCYRHSNEKRNESWFCLPCRPPHRLVWAKQKGYPYWPAKVIRMTNTQYDVRFFGAKHLRALVDKTSIKPIETTVQSLQVKRSQAFNKAMQELTEHQRLLQDPEEVARLMMHPPEIKIRTPNQKTKQKLKRVKDSPNSNNDIYEFQDSPSDPVSSPEKKKRKYTKSIKTTRPSRGKEPKKLGRKPSQVIDVSDSDCNENLDQDHVSSTTERIYSQPTLSAEGGSRPRQRGRPSMNDPNVSEEGTQPLDRAYSDPVERLRRQLEQMVDKDSIVKCATETMQQEIDSCQNAHAEHVSSMVDAHLAQISDIKKKQWCYNCEQEAIYHCCWNTAYCSTVCQQQHWQSEHKKVCRRKR